MTWWTIEVALIGADGGSVAAALVAATGQAVEERAASVIGCSDDPGVAERAEAAIRSEFGSRVDVKCASLATDIADWTTKWREGLGVRHVGGLDVGPSWLVQPGPRAIVIDPEMAFGSGEHGSTRGALTLMARSLALGDTVLDLGSGSGILTIAAIKLGAAQALGIEVDDEAVPIAEENAVRNGVAGEARFVAGDAATLAPLAGPVDLVVSNILRPVNEALLPPILRALRVHGTAIFSGIEPPEASLFRAAAAAAGFRLGEEIVDEGWWSLAARKVG